MDKENKGIITLEEKIKIMENIIKLPENDQCFVFGFIQARLLSKTNENQKILTA